MVWIFDLHRNVGREKFLDIVIENTGGDDRMIHDATGAPRFASASNAWGLFRPIGIKGDTFEESEFERGPKRKYRRKAKHEGQVLDIDLDKAVAHLGIDRGVADMFQYPADKRVKPLKTLRAVFDMASNQPEDMDKYTAKMDELSLDVLLENLKGSEVHIGVVNGLALPRARSGVQPITTLKEAYDLVSQHPEDLAKYSYMGPKMSATAQEDIADAYKMREPYMPASIVSSIKSSWKTLTNAYVTSLQTSEVPEQFLGEDQKPVWKFVPKPV